MQHGMMIRLMQRPGGMVIGVGLLAVTLTLGTVMVARQPGRVEVQLPAADMVQVAARPLDRAFADEAGYVAAPGEYARLGEDYLPLPSEAAIAVQRPLLNRIFADEILGSTSQGLGVNEVTVRSNEAPPSSGPQ
jgi:hypothetical protein